MQLPTSFPRAIAITGAVLAIGAATALGLYQSSRSQAMLKRMAEANNTHLAMTLANGLRGQFIPLVNEASEIGAEQLKSHPALAPLNQAVVNLLRDTNVVKVKIYDTKGLTAFSTDPRQIGEDKSKNAGFLGALSGSIVSDISHRDHFDAFEQTINNRDLIFSYIPLRAAEGQVEAVFELYGDATDLLHYITRAGYQEIVVVLAVLAAMYGLLVLAVVGGYRVLARYIDALAAEENKKIDLERKLRHSHKMDALGTMAGGMAHEFNNILMPMIGLTKLTLRTLPADNVGRSNLQKVIECGDRAKHLVAQVLNFSREQPRKYQAVALGTLVREALGILRLTVPSSITIRDDLDAPCGRVHVDSMELQQVLTNLAANAVYAMKGRPGTIDLALAPVTVTAKDASRLGLAPGNYVRLSVADTGCGMDEMTRARVFEPFFTTKGVGEGTGLGLAVVHGIVADHGGAIAVSSRVNEGTRFDVYFPVVAENAEAADAADGAEPGIRAKKPAVSAMPELADA